MSDLTAERMLHCAHHYYPAGLEKEDPRYAISEETQRLDAILQQHSQGSLEWKRFVERLSIEFPGCTLWDTTVPRHDPCYTCRVSLPGFVTGAARQDFVVCMLSQLSPVYALYASHVDKTMLSEREYWVRFPPFPSEFAAHEKKLSHLVESTFGFTRLDNDVLFLPVRDVVPRTVNFGLGEARLVDCLFTAHRW